MKPENLRRTLGITAILLIVLISYRKMASGNSSIETKSGRLFTVTAATQLSGKLPPSRILVKGLLRKNKLNNTSFLVDEDSVSTNPLPFSCNFSGAEGKNLDELEDDTELVIEGWPQPGHMKFDLDNCTIISINKGTVFSDYFAEH